MTPICPKFMKVTELIKSKLYPPKLQSIKERIKRKPRVLITVLLVLLVIFASSRILFAKMKKIPKIASQPQVQKVALDKSLEFYGLDMQGKSTKDKIKLTFVSAETSSEVLVKDQTYTAKTGKAFLLVNLELQNDTTEKLNIIPGDLIRLTVGSDDKKYAPDLHNNAVLVAPISVKNDRVGFVIDSGVKNFKLLVGELEKKKDEVEIKF